MFKKNEHAISDVLDKLKKRVSLHNNVIDAISTEIKLVEKSLSEANVNAPSELLMKSEEDPQQHLPTEDHRTLYPLPLGYRVYVEHKLAWDHDEQSSSYRLLYIITNAEVVYHDIEEQIIRELRASKIVFKRPFIETKLAVRLEYAKYLKPFIEAFGDAIEVNSIKTKNDHPHKSEIYDKFVDRLMQEVGRLKEEVAYINIFGNERIVFSELGYFLYRLLWDSVIFSACRLIDSDTRSMSIMQLLNHNLSAYSDSISADEQEILEKIRSSKTSAKLKKLRNKLGRAHIDANAACNDQKKQRLYEENKLYVKDLREFSETMVRAVEILSQRSSNPIWCLLPSHTDGPSQLLNLLQGIQ